MINGEYVWYKNKWKNFLLKFKRLFIKADYEIRLKNFPTKEINPKLYRKINITGKTLNE